MIARDDDPDRWGWVRDAAVAALVAAMVDETARGVVRWYAAELKATYHRIRDRRRP